MVKLISLVPVCCIRLCSLYSNFRELVDYRGRFQMVGVRGPLALIPEIFLCLLPAMVSSRIGV